MGVARTYRNHLSQSNWVRFQEGFGESWITSTCVLGLADSNSAGLEKTLNAAGIETRRWWGNGAHTHGATASYPHSSLPVTEALAKSTIGLPFFRDIKSSEIQRIANCIETAAGL
jgi:dTDP-4-amino-4,6-dideoxygalactose transaminase